MKPLSFLNQTKALIALGMSAGLLMSQPGYAVGKPRTAVETSRTPGEEEPSKGTSKTAATKSKTMSSRNNTAVKIYPDIVKRNMHVVAKDNDGKEIDFYVFDLQGTMLQNFKMKEKDHVKIAGLARGKYIYRVFAGDEETASGEFEIK